MAGGHGFTFKRPSGCMETYFQASKRFLLSGGYFTYSRDGTQIPTRSKMPVKTAQPHYNSRLELQNSLPSSTLRLFEGGQEQEFPGSGDICQVLQFGKVGISDVEYGKNSQKCKVQCTMLHTVPPLANLMNPFENKAKTYLLRYQLQLCCIGNALGITYIAQFLHLLLNPKQHRSSLNMNIPLKVPCNVGVINLGQVLSFPRRRIQ